QYSICVNNQPRKIDEFRRMVMSLTALRTGKAVVYSYGSDNDACCFVCMLLDDTKTKEELNQSIDEVIAQYPVIQKAFEDLEKFGGVVTGNSNDQCGYHAARNVVIPPNV